MVQDGSPPFRRRSGAPDNIVTRYNPSERLFCLLQKSKTREKITKVPASLRSPIAHLHVSPRLRLPRWYWSRCRRTNEAKLFPKKIHKTCANRCRGSTYSPTISDGTTPDEMQRIIRQRLTVVAPDATAWSVTPRLNAIPGKGQALEKCLDGPIHLFYRLAGRAPFDRSLRLRTTTRSR
jgi:hypothetical protein